MDVDADVLGAFALHENDNAVETVIRLVRLNGRK